MKDARWSVAEAKARLSEMIQEAQLEPQVISSRGREVAVLMGMQQYDELLQLKHANGPRERLEEFLTVSQQVRSGGGVELTLADRELRNSPLELGECI
jgi:prevent-host-death family protein